VYDSSVGGGNRVNRWQARTSPAIFAIYLH